MRPGCPADKWQHWEEATEYPPTPWGKENDMPLQEDSEREIIRFINRFILANRISLPVWFSLLCFRLISQKASWNPHLLQPTMGSPIYKANFSPWQQETVSACFRSAGFLLLSSSPTSFVSCLAETWSYAFLDSILCPPSSCHATSVHA